MSRGTFTEVGWLMPAVVVGTVMLVGISQAVAATPVVLNGAEANLDYGFTSPPNSAKPCVTWFWLSEDPIGLPSQGNLIVVEKVEAQGRPE